MSGIDASRLAEELNVLLEQGRIVTWLDRNSEYADDLDAVQELLDGATLITINANLFETKLRIFAEDTKSRYVLYRAGELPSLEEDHPCRNERRPAQNPAAFLLRPLR